MPADSDTTPQTDTQRPPRPLIIERADLQTLGQRWGYGSLTLLCWVAWLYLFMPLLSVVAWFAGLTFIYQLLLQDLELVQLWTMMRGYGIGIGVLISIYMLWAITSYLRFRRAQRRRNTVLVTDTQLLASHNITPAQLQVLRTGQRTSVSVHTLDSMFGGQRPRASRT